MRAHILFPACLAAQAAGAYVHRIKADSTVEYGGVDVSLESSMKLMAQYAAAAYCVSNYAANASDVLCVKGVCPDVIADNAVDFTHHVSLVTNENGFVSTDPVHKLVVLALIGTVSLRNYWTDAAFKQEACRFGYGCRVHTGFNSAWIEISRAFKSAVSRALKDNPGYKLVITGHSLGAAVATVAAANLRDDGIPCDLYTFGSPRVFNSIGARYVSNQESGNIRVTHWDDPVPNLPPLVLPGTSYRHTSPEYWLSLGNATRIEYDPSQIAVCPGDANINCNAKFWKPETLAHDYYFEYLTACASDKVDF